MAKFRIPNPLGMVTKILPDQVRHATTGIADLLSPNSRYDYSKETKVTDNSAVSAGVGWFARTFSEAPIAVFTDEDGTLEITPGHPMTDLIRHPNDHYAGITLMNATVTDFLVDGNAYWLVSRDAQNRPVELWYLPTSTVEPKRPDNGSEFISHYVYTPGQTSLRLEPMDVIHFRDGIDPKNTMKGLSRLHALIREIWTDNEASNYTASLLRNLAVPGLIFSPDDAGAQGLDKEARDNIRKQFAQAFGRDKRGGVMVGSGKTKIDVVSFNPKEMDMEMIRAIPESRIAAALGIPAALLGYLIGLKQTAVGATLAELRELGYENGIIPVQRQISEQLDLQLLPQVGALPGEEAGFDLRRVRVLQDDQDDLSTRTLAQVAGGVLKVTDAQRVLGIPVDETQDAYLRNTMQMTLTSSSEEDPVEEDLGDDDKGDDAVEDFPQFKIVGD